MTYLLSHKLEMKTFVENDFTEVCMLLCPQVHIDAFFFFSEQKGNRLNKKKKKNSGPTFKASKLLLISAPSILVCLSELFVS